MYSPSSARHWPHFPTKRQGLSQFPAQLLPLAAPSQRGTRNPPTPALPWAAERCPWCLCSGIKEKAKVAHWKHKWWGHRSEEGQGKDRDKVPNREGALERRVLETVEQFYLLPSSLPLESYRSLSIEYLSQFRQGALSSQFWKSTF